MHPAAIQRGFHYRLWFAHLAILWRGDVEIQEVRVVKSPGANT